MFMKPQIVQGLFYEVDGNQGIEVFPAEHASESDAIDNYRGEADTVHLRSGYGARLSAPGFLDCTEWAVYESVEAAKEALVEMLGDDIEYE